MSEKKKKKERLPLRRIRQKDKEGWREVQKETRNIVRDRER